MKTSTKVKRILDRYEKRYFSTIPSERIWRNFRAKIEAAVQ